MFEGEREFAEGNFDRLKTAILLVSGRAIVICIFYSPIAKLRLRTKGFRIPRKERFPVTWQTASLGVLVESNLFVEQIHTSRDKQIGRRGRNVTCFSRKSPRFY